jgi:hypothetical protein
MPEAEFWRQYYKFLKYMEIYYYLTIWNASCFTKKQIIDTKIDFPPTPLIPRGRK